MPIKFVYFDLDDTLVDHSRAERLAHLDTYLETEELRKIPFDRWLDTYRGINRTLWEGFGNGTTTKKEVQDLRFVRTLESLDMSAVFAEKIRQTYMKYYKQHWAWIAGANSVLKWTASHCPVGILTNGFSEIQHVKYEWFNLETVTKTFVISEEVGSAKPRKAIFEFSEKQAGVGASEILYIGDSWSSDVVGSVNAGWNIVWFNRNNITPPESLGVEIAHDFIQVKEIIAKYLNVYEGT